MLPSNKPAGDDIRCWRRQRLDSLGRGVLPAPIYVMQVGVEKSLGWYTEDGIRYCATTISVSTVIEQGGVELPWPPWDPAQCLPEGF